jgi:hypothetical protein
MYQVETLRQTVSHDAYGRIIQTAWHPVGRPRPFQRASELREIVAKIKPDMITRSRCLSPELFPL